MKLGELAVEYRKSGELLKERIEALQKQIEDRQTGEMERLRIRCRILQLKRMHRYVNEAAGVMEHYYDKEYRNGMFSL